MNSSEGKAPRDCSLAFGEPAEWGLTAQTHRELCAELNDHLMSMQERGVSSGDAMQLTEAHIASLRDPLTRRRLTAAHLADQAYATLHRKPSRQEWRELGWLLFWFALIVASDVFAAYAYRMLTASHEEYVYWGHGFAKEQLQAAPGGFVTAAFVAWLAMGLARAGFFASFAHSLHRAWQTGWGVCLGRIVQLKLIHTVLVVVALMSIGGLIESYSWGGYRPMVMPTSLPAWLSAITCSALLAGAGALIWTLRRHAWQCALFLLIAAGFLYPGGPAPMQHLICTKPLLGSVAVLSDGSRSLPHQHNRTKLKRAKLEIVGWTEPTQAEVESYARYLVARNAQRLEKYGIEPPVLDVLHNTAEYRLNDIYPMPFHIGEWIETNDGWKAIRKRDQDDDYVPDKETQAHCLFAPNAAPGGGVGWLAAPIPLLTCIGLMGLLALMGRRGPLQFLMYFILAGLALGTTLMPFFSGMPANHLMELSPMAIMHTPFPGFEALMVTPLTGQRLDGSLFWEESWLLNLTLVGGLLLSSAIPWLMTALFLKPQRGPSMPPDAEVAG